MCQSLSRPNWEEECRKKREEEVRKVADELKRQCFMAQADAQKKAEALFDAAYFKRQNEARSFGHSGP